jgi:hypothetical protein
MPTNGESLAKNVESSYRKLSTVASELNFVSDELGKHVSELDAALKKLNLGIEVWVPIRGDGPDEHGEFWKEDLGYAKIGGKWGIALRSKSGNDFVDEVNIECWLFSDAPRPLRLASIIKIAELLEKLSAEAKVMVDQIDGGLAQVKEVAEVVKKAAEEPVKRTIARGVSVRPITLGGAATQELKK